MEETCARRVVLSLGDGQEITYPAASSSPRWVGAAVADHADKSPRLVRVVRLHNPFSR